MTSEAVRALAGPDCATVERAGPFAGAEMYVCASADGARAEVLHVRGPRVLARTPFWELRVQGDGPIERLVFPPLRERGRE